MSIFDHFKKPRTNLVPSILEFPAIDTDGMVRRMRLRELGRERGQKNLPSSDNDVLDSVEQSIINEIENEGKTQFSSYLDHQKTYAERAGDASIHSLIVSMATVAGDAITDFERKTHIGTSNLYALKRDLIESERTLNNFKKQHGLERPARDLDNKSIKVGLLILILALEAVLNGFFLSQGSDLGLIGGMMQALLIAAINVFVGVVVGRLMLPWIFHRNYTARVVATLGVGVYLAANAGFNLAVAHYRNAMASDPLEASTLAYRSLLAHPLGIYDLQSWALFIVGFAFSLIAAYDALRMDDPYPGYGMQTRQNRETIEEYNALKDELLAELHLIKKTAEEKMDDLARNIQTRQSEYSFILKKSHALREAMIQHYVHLESAVNTLLSYYRDENRSHRNSPAPARFNTRHTLQRPIFGIPGLTDPNTEEPEEALRRALEELPKHRESLHNGFRKAYAEYKRIDDLVSIEHLQ